MSDDIVRMAREAGSIDSEEVIETVWRALSAAELRRLAAVEAQRDALLEALKEYGWHHEGCPQYPTYTHPDRWPACTCGFDDAIKAVEGEKE